MPGRQCAAVISFARCASEEIGAGYTVQSRTTATLNLTCPLIGLPSAGLSPAVILPGRCFLSGAVAVAPS
eukprot:748245-Pyramimonas_sp.AAC.1